MKTTIKKFIPIGDAEGATLIELFHIAEEHGIPPEEAVVLTSRCDEHEDECAMIGSHQDVEIEVDVTKPNIPLTIQITNNEGIQ